MDTLQEARALQKAWIITFYAYKGGTGRTLALSNVARFLAEEAGYRVGVVDLDIESPGLPHQALSVDLEPGSDKRSAVQSEIDGTRGFADLFLSHASQRSLDSNLATRAKEISGSVNSAKQCAVPLRIRGLGALILMASGKGAVKKSDDYRARASLFNEAVSTLDIGPSAGILTEIVTDFVNHFALDFVLIDARTGTGNFFPTYTYVVPQALVLFLGLNEQNIHGSLSILDQDVPEQVPSGARVILVASPVPTVNPAGLEDGLRRISRQLTSMLEEQKKNRKRLRFALPVRLDQQLPYCDLATYQESYFIDKYPNSLLSLGYRQMAKELQSLVLPSDDSLKKRNAIMQTLSLEPIRIALEDVNYEHMQIFLLRNGYREEDRYTVADSVVARFVLTDSMKPLPSRIELRLWSATDARAPWEAILLSTGDNELPEVMMIPQSSLGILGKTDSVWTLEELRMQLRVECLGSDFLDGYYPGWRKWCAYGPSTYGLPFSLATTILCVNSELFQNQFAPYITNIYGRDRKANLFPTSWQQLYRLLNWYATVTGRGAGSISPFGFADEDRAFYYEWLNVVLACGGADFRTEEGNFSALPAVGETETLEGTWLFVGLAQRLQKIYSRIQSTGSRSRDRSMSNLVAAFNQGLLSMYIAWSDNFLFTQEKDGNSLISRPVRLPNAGKAQAANMLLGQIPRDVRHQRRPLVAGWLMTFPRRQESNVSSATQSAVSFADFFYQPKQQRDLLSWGFPSPSLPLVKRQLDKLEREQIDEHHQHKRNFRFFLLSLRDGLDRGHWVPAFSGAREGIKSIVSVLRKLVETQDLQYQTLCEEMQSLETTLREIANPNSGGAT